MLKHTVLYDEHLRLRAKMVPFAGWEMPISYSSIIEEHCATRNAAGLFDISHMATLKVLGSNALSFIQKLTTNDATKLASLKCQYSVICNASGGVIDDVLVYRLNDDYMIVVNASNADKVLSWMGLNMLPNVEIVDQRETHGIISLQGPKSAEILRHADIKPLPDKKNLCALSPQYIISRTGYTGEDGFEFFVKKNFAQQLWKVLMGAGKPLGLLPCGLGARDTLRLEAGLPLYGNEYDEKTSPLEAGYGWAVKFDKPFFIGKDSLQTRIPKKKLVGLSLEEKSVPRKGFEVFGDEACVNKVGDITSGTFSPSLGKPIAMAYILPEFGGKICFVKIRERAHMARLQPLPFYSTKGGKNV